MRFKRFETLAKCLVGCAVLAIGCNESVTPKDVDAAKKKADQEAREAADARAQSPDNTDKVKAEEAEARDAERKLKETEMKAAATTARDGYVGQIDARMKAADAKVDELQKVASGQDGAAKDVTQKKIDDIKAKRERVDEAVGKMKAAELLLWEQHRAEVQRLTDELNAAIL